MRARALLIAAAAGAIVALPAPASACACGVAPQARIDVERALVVLRDGREDLVISYDLRAAGKRPAVVLPVPHEPKVSAVEGPDPFAYLQRVTTPPPTAAAGGGDGAGAPAGAQPPTIKRSVVGGYSVTRLHGGSGATLERWLHRNGYALPAGAPTILHSYARRGWWFVALRLAKRADGALKPLRLHFATTRAVYPMRLAQLGKHPVNLELYAVTAEEVAVTPLAARFAGVVKDLREPPPSSLAGLLDPDATLTKLQGADVPPKSFRDDLWLRAATSGTARSEAEVFSALVRVVAQIA